MNTTRAGWAVRIVAFFLALPFLIAGITTDSLALVGVSMVVSFTGAGISEVLRRRQGSRARCPVCAREATPHGQVMTIGPTVVYATRYAPCGHTISTTPVPAPPAPRVK